jgi:carboxypeptidase C (cathepsin A)
MKHEDVRRPLGVLAAVFLLGAAQIAPAQEGRGPGGASSRTEQRRSEAAATPRTPLPPESVTSHTIDTGGQTLTFTARAGAVRLLDANSGAAQADIAYVGFERSDAGDAATRPVTFAVNGGPGAASGFLNIGAMGPWRLSMVGAALAPSAPPLTGANSETWLPFTDLVFLDPPGTGFTRILAESDDVRRHFYSVGGDIDILAVTIRKWLEQHNRLASPKFIVGESYGGFRAPKIARALQETENVGVNGIAMLSPVIDFSWFEGTTPLTRVAVLPAMTAVARGVTDRAKLADVEAYATSEYLSDLLKGPRDKAAVDRLSDKVAALLGLDRAFVARLGGRVDADTFLRERGRGQARAGSLYDGSISTLDPNPNAAESHWSDPFLDGLRAPIASAMADITVNQLKWPVGELRYEILNNQVVRQWNWDRGRRTNEALSDLRQTLALDPNMRVLVMSGITDLITAYFGAKLLIDQLPVYGDARRVRFEAVPGGHMFYSRDDARAALRDAGRDLIEGRREGE